MMWRRCTPGVLLAFGFVVGTPIGLPSSARAANAPVVDWEKPWVRKTGGEASPYVNPQFRSTKTLAETTAWLKLAIERYGEVPPDRYDPVNAYHTGDVRFQGCTMQWVERRSIDSGSAVTVDAYSLALSDVAQEAGSMQAVGRSLMVSVRSSASANPLRVAETIYHRDGGTLKSVGSRSADDNHYTMQLQDNEEIPRRVGTALIHAARLCSKGAAGH
jgi:hypothetical protein